MWQEVLSQLKIPKTLSGIEPATLAYPELNIEHVNIRNQDSVVGIETGLRAGHSEAGIPAGPRRLFSKTSRLVLVPTQPLSNLVRGFFRGCKASQA